MTFSDIRRTIHRLVAAFRPGQAETDLAREITAHLQLLEDEFIAGGMSRDEARYAARRAFGGVEQAKEHQRDTRSFRWLAGWPMDLRLGVRMLRRSPGLTIIGVAALAVAIGGGAAYLEFLNDLFRPTLPLPQGDRIVAILNWDAAKGDPEHRSLYEFAIWRDEVRSIEHLGAFVQFQRNVITDDGVGEPLGGVEISAAAFRITGTPPLLGRPLIDADENADASPVAVLSYDLWQSRLAGDPGVVGRTIRLGRTPHTVVGVMPAGFGFPIRDTLWVPLKFSPTELRRADGPRTRIFGRLAPGIAIAAAQSELDAIGARINADTPGTNQQLRPRVMPFVDSLWASSSGRLQVTILYSVNIFFLGLLALCGANVATLVFARTATRQSEITVRTALGASRARIVAQLFAEALVLAVIAAVIGLFAARAGGQWATDTFKAAQEVGAMPFWWNDELAPETILYAAVLTVLAAAVAGVVPALKATGPEMQGRLKEAAAATTIRLGGIWTVVIVGQVAVTVIFLTSLVSLGWNLVANPTVTQSFAFPVREFLTLTFATERQPAGTEATYERFEERLSAHPSIAGVTYTDSIPGRGAEFFVELEGMPSGQSDDDPLWCRTQQTAYDYFATLGMPVIAGRSFSPADAGQAVAIVDETFVRGFLGGRNPIGLRVRQPKNSERSEASPWYQIVGVVRDVSLGAKSSEAATVYTAVAPVGALRVLVRTKQDPTEIASLVRSAAIETDPTLRVDEIKPFERIADADIRTHRFFLTVIAIVAGVALMLATAGIYALMTFTLARRTREIGIRTALGAAPFRVVTATFSRAFMQVVLGVVIGSLPGGVLLTIVTAETGSTSWLVAGGTLASAAFVLVVALLACAVPARRALHIQPTEALRADA